MNYTVKKHDLGYYFIYPLPSEQELKDYYEKKYYQDLTAATYQQNYNEEELAVLKIDAELGNDIYTKNSKKKSKELLDIACGEGFFMKNMKELGWKVNGTDYSSHGVKIQNPDLEDKVIYGELNQVLEKLIQNNKTFDFINLANILEHLIAPIDLLKKCHKLLSHEGVLRVKVPNDFSPLQEYLKKDNSINSYWIHPPDHLSYFNFDSLPKVLNHCNFEIQNLLGDFPIELFLLHPESNYVNKKVGKQAHKARIDYTLNLWEGDKMLYVETFAAFAKAKISRSCIAYVRKQ